MGFDFSKPVEEQKNHPPAPLFIPDQIELLEKRLADVAQHVEALVDVHHHAHPAAERPVQRLDPLGVRFQVGIVQLHLVIPDAARGIALGLGDQVLLGVLAPAAAAVAGDEVGVRPPQLVQRQLRDLRREVPQRDVGGGKRVGRDALLLDAHVDAEHLLPQPLDVQRVFADERRLEPRLEAGVHRFGAAAVEHHAVALAFEARIGRDFRHHELVVRELQRHLVAGRDGEDAGVDGGDFHWRMIVRKSACGAGDIVPRRETPSGLTFFGGPAFRSEVFRELEILAALAR